MSKHFMKYQVKKSERWVNLFSYVKLLYRYKHIIPVYYPNKKREYYKSVSLYLQEHFWQGAWYISQVILQVVLVIYIFQTSRKTGFLLTDRIYFIVTDYI